MAKSRLQKEYEKELRLLERRIKALQRKAQSTFNPKEIEAVTRRKTRPTKKEVARIKALRGEELKTRLSKSTRLEPPKGKRLPLSRVEVSTPRETLPEDLKQERRNFRARVRRLEQQGYDTSQIGSARNYTLEQLKQLKYSELSKLAFKDGRTAYEIRREQKIANWKYTMTHGKLEDWIKAVDKPQKPVENIKPRPQGDYIDAGGGALTQPYVPTAPTMIEYLTNVFESLENHQGVDIREDKATLLGLWKQILSDIGYPENTEASQEYENYLDTQESDIASKCEQITWDSNSERVSVCFANLFWILEKFQPLTAEQSRAIGDITERMTYSDGD